jgi:hypothetical protein
MSIGRGQWWSLLGTALFVSAIFSGAVYGQGVHSVRVGGVELKGVPDDWSHHRVVFSNPGTKEQAIAAGRYEQWLKTVNDPRYVLHQLKRGLPAQGPGAEEVSRIEGQASRNWALVREQFAQSNFRLKVSARNRRFKKASSAIKQDWNQVLGATTAPSAVGSPAKWSFDTAAASCSNDFVVYPTGQAGSPTQASIIAYYNIYASGCSGTVPLTDWAYNTGGTVGLAPIFSVFGGKLAFIQSNSGSASLVVMRIPATPPGTGAIGAPATPTTAATASDFFTGTGCSAPCMYSMPLSGGVDDTNSNPYYDYGSDTLWVGDAAGKLHEFSPVFNGAPAEVTTGWPIQLAAADTNQVSSPVYDPVTGNIFVGTTTSVSTATGGFLYSVNAATGTVVGTSGQLDSANGIQDAPLLDPSAGRLYVFVGRDTSALNDSGLYQFSTSFTAGTGSEVQFGSGGTQPTEIQFDGAFDNTYLTSVNPASPTGDIYVCPTTVNPTAIFQVPITANVMGAATRGPIIGGSSTSKGLCSPITEFFNQGANAGAGADYLMLSVNQGSWPGCSDVPGNGCVMSFDVTNPANWSTSLAPLGTFNVTAPLAAAATTGIVVDNSVTAIPGASQMYFSTQIPAGTEPCAGVCAVQLSQVP